MNTKPIIFIASSSEGLAASNVVEDVLTGMVAGEIIIHHWTEQFGLSKSYIESLEQQVATCDFGIFVLTADDLLSSRDTKQQVPRDNVVFELGLFMGGLGRNRCFIFVENSGKKQSVRIPSDLLGLEVASFTRPVDGNWKAVLEPACERVKIQVKEYIKIYRLPDTVALYIHFRELLLGYWWEKIDNAEAGALSFVRVLADDAYNSLKLEGTSFSTAGKKTAKWESLLVSLEPKKGALIYHWEGKKLEEVNVSFSGFGRIRFDMPVDSNKTIDTADGHFFNINEARINESMIKAMDLRKIKDEVFINTMLHASEAAKAALVISILKEW